MLKKIIAFAVLGVFLGPVFAQTDTSLAARLATMLELTRKKDWDGVMDYTYPKVFDVVAREEFKFDLENSFDNEETPLQFVEIKLKKIAPVFAHGNALYAKVFCSMFLSIKLEYKKGEAKENFDPKQVTKLLKEQYGEENVQYDKIAEKYLVQSGCQMVAIRDQLSPNWTFMMYDDKGLANEDLLSKEVVKKLVSYK